MRILVTSIVDLRKTAHNRLHQFIKHLRRNHEITVLSINDWWKAGETDVQLYAQGLEGILKGVNIRHFTERRISPVYQEAISIATLGRILKEIHYADFDVHLNYSSLLSGYSVAKRMDAAGIRSVYDVADDLPAMVRSSPQMPAIAKPIAGRLGERAFKKNVAIARQITVISESLAHSLRLPPSKTAIVPNGVDIELFVGRSSPQLREKLGLERAFVLGYVGVLREWVDLEPVFAAVKELDKTRCAAKVLVVGEEGGLEKNKALARRYGLADQVIFTGTVPYVQVPEYVSCMDICLLPFKKDAVSENAVPLKLFEYMACQKPVISAPLAGVRQAVGDRVVYASDASELGQKVMELCEKQDLRTEMGLQGRRFIEENYSWVKACTRLEEILSEAAKGERG